ncbi:MAG: S8 family serine peptidase [Patescibacteria group bacterium]|nr:S8 family serine peptidase [Patescibacteria group bacterium]
MKKKITSFFNVFIFALSLAILFLFPIKDAASAKGRDLFKTDEILVKFKAGKELIGIKIKPYQDYYQILDGYQRSPSVEYAEPDYLYRASIIPSDTYFANQWYLNRIGAVAAWDNVRESPDIVIAILDSGVDIKHPDLKDNIWINKKEIAGNGLDDDKNGFIDDVNGWDFVNDVPDPAPKFQLGFTEEGINHGTIIAGIAAASGNNAAGIAGVSWKTRLMPLKILDDKGEGGSSKVIKAIDYAVASGANIINLSFIGFGYSKGLDEAIKRAFDAGVIVVAAGGNEQGQGEGYNLDETPIYPACLDGSNGQNRVIGVAATDTLDQKAPFSSFGGKCIDIAAPGISIFSTVAYSPENSIDGQPFNKYYDGYWSGTSVAVPMVSAGIALIEAANPALNRNEVLSVLFGTADNINMLNPSYINKLGSGRINLSAAVAKAQNILRSKTEKLLVAPRAGFKSLVKIADQDGRVEKEFLAFDEKFKGGVNLASGDINGDGKKEIVAAAGPGGGPHVKIFNFNGELVGQWFVFDKAFRGGAKVACADVNHDGADEVIAVQELNGNSEIRMFNGRGQMLGSFYAYDNKFRGGLDIATGDIDGDGEEEIVTGLGSGKIPEVKVFKAIGILQNQFLAYPKTFRGGIRVLIADIKGGTRKNRTQIITAPAGGGGPNLEFFDSHGNLLSHFFAFKSNFRGGVNLAKADVDNDGLDEIITAAGPSGAPHVRVFEANGAIIGSFYAYEEKFSGGVNVGSIKIIK